MPVALRPLSFFAVRHVEVSGTRFLQPAAVVQGLGLRSDASVFDDLGTLERRLETLAGVASARVRRRLPSTLRVDVTEVEPVALAEGPAGLVPLARDARPLPYDVVAAPVDAPIVRDADRPLLEALRLVQTTDLELYGEVAAAQVHDGDLALDLNRGRVLLRLPVDPEVVRAVAAVWRDVTSNGLPWRELDGRFRRWVVVRRDMRGTAAGNAGAARPAASRPARARTGGRR
jgi:hypothetical protein